MKKTLNSLLAVMAGAALALSVTAGPAAVAQPATEKPAAKDTKKAEPTLDTIIFKSGRTVQGYILKETDTTIRVKVVGAGGLSVETDYSRSDILTIEKGAAAEADPKADPKKDPKATTPGNKIGTPGSKKESEAIAADTTTIYLATLTGEFGRDVSATPMRALMEDAKKLQPDIIVLKLDSRFSVLGDERPDYYTADAGPAFNQLETARQVSTIITDDIRDDPKFVTRSGGKPRLVMWVKKALGGVAFLPFVAPDIYYTSDGRHGNVGYLEFIFGSTGDQVVREKQYSLRLARAEGLAEKGGHDPLLVRAMSRADFVLSVDWVGGKPVFHSDDSGELLLTDDASEQGQRRDTIQDVARFKGNDVLTLDAPMAFKLGLSSGTADTNEDLAFELGVARNHKYLENKSERILKNWSEDVTNAERDFIRLWREYERNPVQGEYEERTRARGKRIQLLQEIRSLLTRFEEAINPRAIQGAPAQWETQINIMLEALKQAQRLDRR